MTTNFILRGPAYEIQDDEKTRPGVVPVNWTSDELTVRIAMPSFVRPRKSSAPSIPPADEFDPRIFRPGWHGIGRTVGYLVLAAMIGLCAATAVFAVFEPGATQVETRAAWHEVPQR